MHAATPVPDLSPTELLAAARSAGLPDRDLPTDPELLVGRRIVLDGAYNVRDLGGYRTADGEHETVWRTVLRSDHLHTLTDTDVAALSGLSIERIHDFRLEKERERQPSRRFEPAPEVVLLNVGDAGTDEAAVDVVLDILAGRRPLPPGTFWDEGYLDMIERARPMFVALIASLADGPAPSMFHCTGGKDRTGISAALFLELLGVSRDVAMDDFLATNVFRTPVRAVALRDQLAGVGVNVVDALPILGVCRSALQAAWDRIDSEYGGSEEYLVRGGLDPSAPARLRARYLV
jgi:protein-tyrosine phosphatase